MKLHFIKAGKNLCLFPPERAGALEDPILSVGTSTGARSRKIHAVVSCCFITHAGTRALLFYHEMISVNMWLRSWHIIL